MISQGAAMPDNDYRRFANLTFNDFRQLAVDKNLSRYEKIGFPDSYREGKEQAIFQDITRKLGNLSQRNQLVVDVGPGCSGLALMLIDLCRLQGHTLVLVDSPEMLDHLPNESFITKVPACYPRDCLWMFETYAGKVNTLLTYSVLHYVFAEGNVFEFVDRSLSLLTDGGEMLIGDVPNVSKRKRFFAAPNGVKFHQWFTGTDEVPSVEFNMLETGQIDDTVILSLIMRCRQSGFDAYWLPQADDLPMANRREDLLIRKP
jgi:hypothetical protein